MGMDVSPGGPRPGERYGAFDLRRSSPSTAQLARGIKPGGFLVPPTPSGASPSSVPVQKAVEMTQPQQTQQQAGSLLQQLHQHMINPQSFSPTMTQSYYPQQGYGGGMSGYGGYGGLSNYGMGGYNPYSMMGMGGYGGYGGGGYGGMPFGYGGMGGYGGYR